MLVSYCMLPVCAKNGRRCGLKSLRYFIISCHVISYPSCRRDFLKISNDHMSGVYCGEKTGETVQIAGDNAVITFHSDSFVQRRGFSLSFTLFPGGKCNRKTHVTD